MVVKQGEKCAWRYVELSVGDRESPYYDSYTDCSAARGIGKEPEAD